MKKQTPCINADNPFSRLAESYLDYVRNTRRNEAVRLILDSSEQGVEVKDLYLHVFQPVQYEMGRLWQTNQVSIAQERYCTAVTQLVMSYLYPKMMTLEKKGLTMVSCCVSGEFHELGIRMVTDFLEMNRWDTYYLGANTPDEEVVRTVKEQKAHLLAISATMLSNRPRVKSIVKEVRQRPGLEDVKIIVGGHAFMLSLIHI